MEVSGQFHATAALQIKYETGCVLVYFWNWTGLELESNSNRPASSLLL
jgi:hypothetical protein